jgi:peptidyl-dipeptidase A
MKNLVNFLAGAWLVTLLVACSPQAPEEPAAAAAPAETAEEFVARVNAELEELGKELSAAAWVRATYITEDTAVLATAASARYAKWHSETVQAALAFNDVELDASTRRAIERLKLGTSAPAPGDPAKRNELAALSTELEGIYNTGQYCRDDGECLYGSDLEQRMATARDYDDLLDYWSGWRSVAAPMRDKYVRFVELANEGAVELGYANVGEMWRSNYDMSPAEFQSVSATLWDQVKPLYDELHCHVRAKLGEVYGADKVPQDGPIPAHLLGNMWSQQWGTLYDLMEPYPGVGDIDVDATLKAKDFSPKEMVRSAENFYASLGMPRLPDTFWERSQFSRPQDREVDCYASAWGMDGGNDVRIKMCINQTYDELRVIYHELGHNYYQRAYKDQPPLFQDAAHDGFHEAIGDAIVLSMTPGYLAEVGLVSSGEEDSQAVINRQMQTALNGIAFLPFGKLIDEWRWGVFSGEIAPDNYSQAWWDLRTRYQGITPPVERTEADFDPGAKYHIPANVPYSRYFLAAILQYQFHRALCQTAGYEGELHACSIYGSEEAGDKFYAMLEAGASQPWQDTLELMTGTREMDATAIIDYFAPLMAYLKEQNEARSCGW